MAKEYAPGIPDKANLGDISKLRRGDLLDFIVQKHLAERAGKHYDVRFGTPETGLFSFATKKELPEAGKKISLFQQPLHTHEYKDYEGTISKGNYGAGKVEKYLEDKLLVTNSSPDHISFTLSNKQNPERFTLIKPKDSNRKDWLLVKHQPISELGAEKIKYTTIPQDQIAERVENLQPGDTVQPKVDGALSIIALSDNKAELMSHRISKRTDLPIVHTERFSHGNIPIPKGYNKTILKGEMYGEREGKAIPPQELSGLLNANIAKSIERQRERGIDLKTMLFDVSKYKGKPAPSKYSERYKLLQELATKLPKNKFSLPELSKTPSEAMKMLKAIQEGKHPLTIEGIVIHPEEGVPSKGKLFKEHDVHIRNIFPGEKRLEGKAAGGFEYSLTPNGPIVGKVGTGLSDEVRKEMHNNPEDWIGRVARVHAEKQYSSGALKTPAFLALHEDYPIKKAFINGFNKRAAEYFSQLK